MKTHVFIDSNIWLYSFLPDSPEKYLTVKNLFEKNFRENIVVISYQVVNEFSYNLKKKKFPEDIIRNIILAMESSCVIVDFTIDLLIRASELREKHLFSFWDSLILSSSILAGCTILYTEDMQDGREVEGTLIKNPLFKS